MTKLIDLDAVTPVTCMRRNSAFLLGFSWELLHDADNVVRLLLAPGSENPDAPVVHVYLHELTPLQVVDTYTKDARYIGPGEFGLYDDIRLRFQNHFYGVAQRTSAAWSYFAETGSC